MLLLILVSLQLTHSLSLSIAILQARCLFPTQYSLLILTMRFSVVLFAAFSAATFGYAQPLSMAGGDGAFSVFDPTQLWNTSC